MRVPPSVRAGKLSVCRMILNKPWHRAWCDFFNLYVVGICNFGQHPAIGARIGADKADGLALIVILKHVAAEECVNGMAHKTIDVVLVELVHQESGIDTQRVARKRMVVDCRHYLVGRQIDILEKVVDKLRRSNVLQAVAEKPLADIRGAALVAKNIAQRAHILHYRAAVVIARVGAAAENTGYARLVDQQPAAAPRRSLSTVTGVLNCATSDASTIFFFSGLVQPAP